VARRAGAGGAPILADGRLAFVHAMGNAVLVGAVVALAGALVALIWLPARAATSEDIRAGATPEPTSGAGNGEVPRRRVTRPQGRRRTAAATTGRHSSRRTIR
jgi:hypothetical protein